MPDMFPEYESPPGVLGAYLETGEELPDVEPKSGDSCDELRRVLREPAILVALGGFLIGTAALVEARNAAPEVYFFGSVDEGERVSSSHGDFILLSDTTDCHRYEDDGENVGICHFKLTEVAQKPIWAGSWDIGAHIEILSCDEGLESGDFRSGDFRLNRHYAVGISPQERALLCKRAFYLANSEDRLR